MDTRGRRWTALRRNGMGLGLAALLLGLAAPAAAELGGDCKLKAPEFGNPGLGCDSPGAGCTINGKAGKCTNMKRAISSPIYCVCSPDGTAVPEEVEAKAVARGGVAKACGSTTEFTIDESAPHIVDIAFPRSMGGKVVRLESFTGSFTVTTTALDDDRDHCQVTIESGQFTAPSFRLPDGRETGINHYSFEADNASSGMLDLTTGKYTAVAQGRISNGLYESIPTQGTYRGTVDFDAGTITIDTTTLDTLEEAVPLPVLE